MSVVQRIIDLYHHHAVNQMKGKTMEDFIENPPSNYDAINQAIAESNHPVLQQLKDKIAEQETQIANLVESIKVEQENGNQYRERWSNISNSLNQYKDRVQTVLAEAIEDYDEDTIRHIADNLDVELTLTKTYEVNVTFRITADIDAGNTIDPEWDFDFSVSSNSSYFEIADYSSDVIWSNGED